MVVNPNNGQGNPPGQGRPKERTGVRRDSGRDQSPGRVTIPNPESAQEFEVPQCREGARSPCKTVACRPTGSVRLGYVIVLRRISDYGSNNGAPLVAFYDTLGIRRTYSRLKPPASSRGSNRKRADANVSRSAEVAAATSASAAHGGSLSYPSPLSMDLPLSPECVVVLPWIMRTRIPTTPEERPLGLMYRP